MGIVATILGVIGGLTTIVGILNILEIPSTPVISDAFTYTVWFWISALLFLAAMLCMLGRKQDGGD